MKHREIPREFESFADEVGRFIHYWGFKQVHGRIWTHLYLSETPLDAGELMARLGISKALTSISLADLCKYDVIVEAGKGPRGIQLYRANPDIAEVILQVLRHREKEMLSQTASALSRVEGLDPEVLAAWKLDPDRVRSMREYVRGASEALDLLLRLKAEDLMGMKKLLELAQETQED